MTGNPPPNSRAFPPRMPRKKEKFCQAQRSQKNEDSAQGQLLFERGTCRKVFEIIATLNDDEIKQKQQPRVRCRNCRKTFADLMERNHHFQTSLPHFSCRYCKNVVVEFGDADSLRYHYIDRHHELYCHFCDWHFPNTFQRLSHMEGKHWSCSACHKMFPMSELDNNHCRTCYSVKISKEFPETPNEDRGNEGRLPNHYARLGISADSSHEQVLKAAKELRVKTHPDRLKRKEGLTEGQRRAIDAEAALVVQTADVLSNPVLRQNYDCKMHGW